MCVWGGGGGGGGGELADRVIHGCKGLTMLELVGLRVKRCQRVGSVSLGSS